jgi:hypothetical protein
MKFEHIPSYQSLPAFHLNKQLGVDIVHLHIARIHGWVRLG